MIFLKIHVGASLLALVASTISVAIIAIRQTRNYARYAKEIARKNSPQKRFFNLVKSYIKLMVVCFIPILNLSILHCALFRQNDIEKTTIENFERRLREMGIEE